MLTSRRTFAIAGALALLIGLSVAPAAAGTLRCGGSEVTLEGTEEAETIRGEPGTRDVIHARGGNDVVIAGDQDDIVCGGEGDDDIGGGSGNDQLFGGPGTDTIRGKVGDDSIQGMAGNDSLYGGEEEDGSEDFDVVSFAGSTDAMLVDLSAGTSRELDVTDAAGDGADVLNTFERVEGSPHPDRLIGNDAANRLSGFGGADVLDGRGGSDELFGGDNGDGGDTASFATETSGVAVDLVAGTARVGEAVDRLDSIENVEGSKGRDRLRGDDGANRLIGLLENDTFEGRGGPDVMGGGAGSDTVSYASARSKVQVDLAAGTGTIGSSQADALENIENFNGSMVRDIVSGTRGANRIVGNRGDDELMGRDGRDILQGRTGGDTLSGQGGDDVLEGGDGNDTLDGGSGRNVCRAGTGTDTIRNCP